MVCAQPMESAPRIARVGRGIIVIGWCLFVASFFLPATNVLQMPGSAPGTPMTGWDVMRSLHVLGSPVVFLAFLFAQPRAFVLLAFPFTNLAAFASPCFLSTSDEVGPILSYALLIAGILPWFIPPGMLGDRFIGYWLWQASFFVMAAGWQLAALDD